MKAVVSGLLCKQLWCRGGGMWCSDGVRPLREAGGSFIGLVGCAQEDGGAEADDHDQQAPCSEREPGKLGGAGLVGHF